MMLSGADCDLRLHDSLDGTSNAFDHVERTGAIDLADVHERMEIVFNWWAE